MPNDILTLRSLDLERDGEKLAQMWNASDDEWPGTWTGGVPITARWVIDAHRRYELLDTLVWDAGDRIGGYCSLRQDQEEPDVIYLPLLNVAPGFQGQSLGRKLLVRAVGRVVEWKKYRLDLDTWPGNLKAVPLYKKCGFFWMPGPDVKLFNFMPAILQMPCAKGFFAQHDWYAALQRELTQTPDDEQWEGLNVFVYRFVGGEDRLTVRVDREARRITAVDTADFSVSAVVDDIAPVRGGAATMRWRIVNRRNAPTLLSLIARETGDLSIDYREERQLAPGETLTLEAPVEVSGTAGTVDRDRPAPAVVTRLRLGDTPVELGTGLRPRAPMILSVHPEDITLLPGAPQTVHLQLRSHLSQEAEASIRITPSEGLKADRMLRTVTLPADGYAGVPVTLEAERSGVMNIALAARCVVDGKPVTLPADVRTVFALPFGGLLCAHTGSAIRIENETLRAVLNASAGDLTITDRATGEPLTGQGGRPIPPQWPSEFKKADFTLSLDREGDTAAATATFASKRYPGFVFRRTVRMNAGPILTVDHAFENNGFEPYTFRLYHYANNLRTSASTLTLPLREGLVRERCADFPGPHDTAFETSPVYEETWAAYEMPHGTVGLFWPDDGEEISWSWNELGFITREVVCPPQSSVRFGTMRLYAGAGDWRTVRRIWCRLAGRTVAFHEPQPRSLAAFTAVLDPPVVAAADGPVTATLRVKQLLSRPNTGTARLILPEGWQSDRTAWAFTEVTWQSSFRAEVRLSATAAPGAYAGKLVLAGAECDAVCEVPLIRLGDGSPVRIDESEVEGHRVLTIRNGRLEIDVTPSFAGAVSAIRDERGVNHLASAFPEPEAFNWLYPWHGGIAPIIDSPQEMTPPGLIVRERFEARPVSCADPAGIVWTGVRQRAVLSHEQVRGMTLELDTLTVGGSPVVKQVWRFYNTTSSVRRVRAGWSVFVQPDGDRSRTTLFTEDYERKRSGRTFSSLGGHWAAAEHPETGRAVALISPVPAVEMDDWGKTGGHLALRPHHTVPASGTVEMIAYVVIADSREAVRRFGKIGMRDE